MRSYDLRNLNIWYWCLSWTWWSRTRSWRWYKYNSEAEGDIAKQSSIRRIRKAGKVLSGETEGDKDEAVEAEGVLKETEGDPEAVEAVEAEGETEPVQKGSQEGDLKVGMELLENYSEEDQLR